MRGEEREPNERTEGTQPRSLTFTGFRSVTLRTTSEGANWRRKEHEWTEFQGELGDAYRFLHINLSETRSERT